MTENRYSRQKDCAADFEQTRLQSASALIAGVGGLGCTAAMLLAAAGIGTLLLCDHDTVSISNLNRQLLYSEKDLGKKKAPTAAAKLKEINPECRFLPIDCRISTDSLEAIPLPHIILDCLDNLEARIALIAHAARHDIPLVHAAIQEFTGQLSSFIPHRSGCPVCAVSGDSIFERPRVSSLGACVSTLAGLQATEAIKILAGVGKPCTGQMVFFDLLSNNFETLNFENDPACIACGTLRGKG